MHVVFTLSDNEAFAMVLQKKFNAVSGEIELRRFPDGETYVRIPTNVKGKRVFIVCTLDHPDHRIIPLYFTIQSLKDSGAKNICLISPYLPYLRHDRLFRHGEALSAHLFARLLSTFADSIVTIDPHLHRIESLDEIYEIPVTVLQSAVPVSRWISANVNKPILIGPDSESEQWVRHVADLCKVQYIILDKTRKGDEEVETLIPEISHLKNYTPVILDDIISTGQSMLKVVQHLSSIGFANPVCICTHALFAGTAHQLLLDAGAKVVSCNTVKHESNGIYIEEMLNEVK